MTAAADCARVFQSEIEVLALSARHIVNGDSSGTCLVTADPLRYLLDFQCRLARRRDDDDGQILLQLLVKLLIGNASTASGCSWFKILFCCKLLELGSESRLPPAVLVRGYGLALRVMEWEMENSRGSAVQRTIKWGAQGAVEGLIALVQTVLSQYASALSLRGAEVRSHAVFLLETFLSLALLDNDAPAVAAKSIVYVHRRGLPTSSAVLLKSGIVLDIAAPVTVLSNATALAARRPGVFSMKHVIVAIFESSLEVPSGASISDCTVSSHITLDGLTVEAIRSHQALASPKAAEFQVLEAFARMLQRSHVNVVICQKRIHPHLCRVLSKLGIASLPRVSVVHIGSMLRTAGARQLGGLSSAHAVSEGSVIDPSHLGYLAFLGHRSMLGTVCLVAQGGSSDEVRSFADTMPDWSPRQRDFFIDGILSRQHLLSTLFVSAPSAAQCTEAEHAYKHVFASLQEMLVTPTVLAGRGSWQQYFSQLLTRDKIEEFCRVGDASSAPSRPSMPTSKVESFPFKTCATGCFDGRSNLSPHRGKRDVHAAAEMFGAALSCCARCDARALAAGHDGDALETLHSNRVAMRMATEVAICLLEIDGAV